MSPPEGASRGSAGGTSAPPKRVLRAVCLAASCALLAGCSILLDWSNFTPAGDGGTGGAGEASVPGALCGTNLRCAAGAPLGWSGPSALYDGPASGAPTCGPGTTTYNGSRALSAPPASCGACNCSTPSLPSCSPPAITGYSDPNCNTATGPAKPITIGDCVAPDSSSVAYSVSQAAPSITSCNPTGGAPSSSAPSWGEAVVACVSSAAAQGSCEPSEVCVPTPSSPFRQQFCIQQSGIATECPTGTPYTSGPIVAYGSDVTDSRGCTRCTCVPTAAGQCFSGPIVRFNGPSCSITLTGTDLGGLPVGCSPASGSVSFKTTISGPNPTQGRCAPSGGTPNGQATPNDPTSFCCTP